MRVATSVWAVMATLAAGAAFAADKAPPTEAKMLQKLHGVNLMEIDMGNAARANSQNDKVQGYARKLVADHQKADDELKSLAQTDGISIDVAMEPGAGMKHDDAKLRELRGLSGSAFDRAFLTDMVKGHEKVIHHVVAAQANATGAYADFLAKLLPQLQAHRDDAQKLMPPRASARNAPKP
jgi:putative membrane protein